MQPRGEGARSIPFYKTSIGVHAGRQTKIQVHSYIPESSFCKISKIIAHVLRFSLKNKQFPALYWKTKQEKR